MITIVDKNFFSAILFWRLNGFCFDMVLLLLQPTDVFVTCLTCLPHLTFKSGNTFSNERTNELPWTAEMNFLEKGNHQKIFGLGEHSRRTSRRHIQLMHKRTHTDSCQKQNNSLQINNLLHSYFKGTLKITVDLWKYNEKTKDKKYSIGIWITTCSTQFVANDQQSNVICVLCVNF